MSFFLTTDIILKSVGKRVSNTRGNYLGEVVEITRDPSGDTIEYIIIKSNQLFDQEDRFFAIPVSSSIIKITEAGEIILLASKDELHLANGITPDRCPKPNFQMNPLIFELFEYDGPELRE